MVIISTAVAVGTAVVGAVGIGVTSTVALAAIGLATQIGVSVGLGLLARAATGISADSLDPSSLSHTSDHRQFHQRQFQQFPSRSWRLQGSHQKSKIQLQIVFRSNQICQGLF